MVISYVSSCVTVMEVLHTTTVILYLKEKLILKAKCSVWMYLKCGSKSKSLFIQSMASDSSGWAAIDTLPHSLMFLCSKTILTLP